MNFYTNDSLLKEILKEKLDDEFFHWAERQLERFGHRCATEIDERARHTDREGQPQLIKYDKYGKDQSKVWVNEGYRQTVEETYGEGIVAHVHREIPALNRKGNYLYSFAQGYLLSQSEPGFYCPVTLTMATAYLLDRYGDDELKQRFLPHVLSTGETELYEGATFLTERQGGSDVGANETEALYVNEDGGGHYRLYGEKYFASNAGMCGVAMVLARIADAQEGTKGLSLFLVPWRTENGELNRLSIRRLKDKLGVKAVPSGEVEFDGAKAYLVGDPARGFYYMMEALNLSRICNAVASVGIMRRAYTEAKTYAEERSAFGRALTDYPMVQDSLVRLKVKLDAELITTFELIGSYDQWYNGNSTPEKDGLLRLLIALIKAETADQAIHFSHETIEMLGGNGYIEDFVTPRLLRDAQVLTVWEGTRNILGLEVLRLMDKFQVHTVFTAYLKEQTADLVKLENETAVKDVKDAISSLEEEMAELAGLDAMEKTRYIKPLSKKMVTVLESVMLLKRASAKPEDDTALLTAHVYVQDQLLPLFNKKSSGWTQEEGKQVLTGTSMEVSKR
ncbi:acyl-CoA dehydrogenase family protein [Salipaludibacillus sp. CUR1]|uniref:acyl-CoA dehydrogenase family protein n=1 Tax=Salipaludibacillus sp. CUR1 TaxID=2820003 RepID=UPI001E588229|nr:acyl-CoA dehydrogenase family protein [Salipaludibacillus sp. CUR1]MCE7792692.1 acyl-CoA dehydrogenase family protein [Salipaludibacillus sp. CUR1]